MCLPKSYLLWALKWCTTPWFWHVPVLPFWGSASSTHHLPCIPPTLDSQWAMSYCLWLSILRRGLRLTLAQLWALHIGFHYSKPRSLVALSIPLNRSWWLQNEPMPFLHTKSTIRLLMLGFLCWILAILWRSRPEPIPWLKVIRENEFQIHLALQTT